jgi:hypothetical protein
MAMTSKLISQRERERAVFVKLAADMERPDGRPRDMLCASKDIAVAIMLYCPVRLNIG